MTQEQLQEELTQTKEQLQKLKADVADLKKKIFEYDNIRREYESKVEEQASQRENRTSSQFGWGQAINFVPVFSHAYSYGTSKVNESVEKEQKEYRGVLSRLINNKYDEIKKLFETITSSED